MPGRDAEHDYGHHWTLPSGQRARLSWNVTTGVLYLQHPDRNRGATALLVAKDSATVDRLLDGWDQGDLSWLRDRLWRVGATLPTWADPASRGR